MSRLQDLPPEGGYNPINFKRVPLRPLFNWKFLFGTYIGISTAATYVYYLTAREIDREEVEMRSCHNVILPVYLAENDREYLKQIRRNRDDEAELMKNVPGWVVGTWYGERVYKTDDKNQWRDPHMYDFYAHSDKKYFNFRAFFRHYF